MQIKKTLVVDNDPVLLTLLENHLQSKGYEVISAKDGLSALETMNSYVPDVIFTDYVMPNIDGDRLCRIIRGNPYFKDCFLVMMSAAAAEEKGSLEEEKSADVVLAKQNFDSLSLHIDGILQSLEEGKSSKLKGKTIAADELFEREITKELLESQKHYEMTLNNMSEGLLELTIDAKIIYANPAAVSIIGSQEEKLLSIDFTSLFNAEDRKRIRHLIKEVRGADEEITIDKPVKLLGKPVAIKIIPVFSESRSTLLIILKDLTERKQLEDQLRHAQKMEALGTLTSGVAHDFNNILNIIMGYAELIEAEVAEEHLPQNSLDQINSASRRARDIIRQLLLFSRKGEEEEVEPREIGLSVKEALKMIHATTPAYIEIRENIPSNLPLVKISISNLHQVIVNLCKNAVDAMDESGGILSVHLEHLKLPGHEKCLEGNLSEGDYVKLTVSDTGHGISLENLGRVFDPYFTTKAQDQGTGLGLSVVLGIVEYCGGGVNVESKLGAGSSFMVYFPVADHGATAETMNEDHEEMPTGNENVLTIDDEESTVNLNAARLQKLGYQVEKETDPERGLEKIKANPKWFDLVFTDLTMPKMDGQTLCREIQKINPDIKILTCTGYNKEIMDNPDPGINAIECIEKPFDMKTLATKIRQALDQ